MEETFTNAINTTAPAEEFNVLAGCEAAFAIFKDKGPHPEYQAFEAALGPTKRRAQSVWRFIYDAVHATGGFSDGSYLFPYTYEVDETTGAISQKFRDRCEQADYDPFAAKVCNTAWDQIVSVKDLVVRSSTDSRLDEFFDDVDRRGSHIAEFLEYPFRQARMYGTGWVFIDRPSTPLVSLADDTAPENRPYLYSVPTQNVVWWEFDEDNILTAIIVAEPTGDYVSTRKCPMRVWTRDAWALYAPAGQSGDYLLAEGGLNPIGEVPAIPIFNETPEPGRALGHSEMLAVAKLAQSVYEIDSEMREHERKCNTIFAIPVKDSSQFTTPDKAIVIGTNKALTYDGEAGEPRWISADLAILTKLDDRRKAKIESAFDAASLRAFVGVLEATSGFHAEVEMLKTEQRIAGHAAALEAVEMAVARLFLKFLGTDPNSADVRVVYPRKFGINDQDKLLDRTDRELKMAKGDRFKSTALREYFAHRFPRLSDDDIDLMVQEELAAIQQATAAQPQPTATEDDPSPTLNAPTAHKPQNPPSKDGTTEAGVVTNLTLNGAQITAAIDVLENIRNGVIGPVSGLELLVAVGIQREQATAMVDETKAKPMLVEPTQEAA